MVLKERGCLKQNTLSEHKEVYIKFWRIKGTALGDNVINVQRERVAKYLRHPNSSTPHLLLPQQELFVYFIPPEKPVSGDIHITQFSNCSFRLDKLSKLDILRFSTFYCFSELEESCTRKWQRKTTQRTPQEFQYFTHSKCDEMSGKYSWHKKVTERDSGK